MSPSLNLRRASGAFRSFVQKIRSFKRPSSSPLCDLPLELLLEISAYLDAPALCSFRLTCRSLYNCTFSEFCKTYLEPLETVTTDLSCCSLRRLNTLSLNPRISPHVRSLDIDGTKDEILGRRLQWERHPSGLLDTSQESVRRLQGILLRLVNCETFRLYQHFTQCCPGGSQDILCSSDTITIILSIVAAIERPIREFHILFKPPEGTGGNRINMSRVDTRLVRDPKFITAFSTLESLTCNYSMDTKDMVDFAAQLIQHAGNRLRRLNIDPDHGYGLTDGYHLLSRLYAAQITLKLHEFTLHAARVGSSDAFINFLSSCKQSLTKLSLDRDHLDSGNWASVLRALSRFPSLIEIHTYLLSDPESKIHFPAVIQDPVVDPVLGTKFSYTAKNLRMGQITLMVAYSGRSMDVALQKLADYATPWKLTVSGT
ncbi:F-box domain protein [Aspergillus mulundensis]|uniref:F-box domain-containing protein n=1 Tax=Aspergillus mulundensis TaxID=1810919 RepID=A0A3D8RE64_9EURO|nr:hypothetical protein DSM5745_07442 [Aspergillus mulundensis]RDW72270.1 hypothetical protein DSM5745_07442 [Aspergillus mulundensis]